jgi:carbamoyltransferase
VLASQRLPHSLGLVYEDATEHLGFLRSSDEFKVMALASYGRPRHLDFFRQALFADGQGGFRTRPIDWTTLCPRRAPGSSEWSAEHADVAASLQRRLEEVLLDLAGWLYEATGGTTRLAMAGGVALNCVANAHVAANGPFSSVWVQPAAGDAGTALGAALHVAADAGDVVTPMPGADLGPEYAEQQLEQALAGARVPYQRPASVGRVAAEVLAADGVVAWYQGRAEYGPRALGRRSLLAHPGHVRNVERLNQVKGREQFRPVAPMVLADRAQDIFDGVLPSPYMLFTHDVRPAWRGRIPAVVHVDGTARIQTVDRRGEPLLADLLTEFERRTGLPVVVNTSLNTAERPMVCSPRDALELYGSSPIDLLVLGPFTAARGDLG